MSVENGPKSYFSENVKVPLAIQKSIAEDTYAPTMASFTVRPMVSLTHVPSVAPKQNIAPVGKQTICRVF
ncbi:MAG: hypothetical protein EBY35_14310 [Rhodobacteraceae bacterium]|nr:hypothetical protein [Paracoccaceae bacterium]NDH27358.1 hypothetical protein [Paracoccaceae bacterium]